MSNTYLPLVCVRPLQQVTRPRARLRHAQPGRSRTAEAVHNIQRGQTQHRSAVMFDRTSLEPPGQHQLQAAQRVPLRGRSELRVEEGYDPRNQYLSPLNGRVLRRIAGESGQQCRIPRGLPFVEVSWLPQRG